MFGNYLVTALRNIARHRLYSLINIVGLAVGLACAVFIILFVRDEISYDKWIAGSENLYRIEHTFVVPGQAPMPAANAPFPVAVAMGQQIPEVTGVTHLTGQRLTVMIGNRLFLDQFHVVDPNFFQLIKLPLVEGNPATVFSQADSVVLSQARARKYFGDAQALGRTIILSENRCDDVGENCVIKQYDLKVSGVMRDVPHNSHLLIDALFPTTSNADPFPQREKTAWFDSSGYAYARLAPGADPRAVEAKVSSIIDRSADPRLLSALQLRASEIQQIHLTPFRDLHLTTDTEAKRAELTQAFSGWDKGEVEVRLTPNRGRDVAPKLITLADAHARHQIVLHLHSKKSPHDSDLKMWRDFLYETLMGDADVAASVLGAFEQRPDLGLIAPQHYFSVRNGVGWHGDLDAAERLARRMDIALDADGPLDFPTGSMFWARSAALKPLLDLGLAMEDFEAEAGQADGTLAHAIERLYFHACEKAGYRWIKIARPELARAAAAAPTPIATPEDLARLIDQTPRLGRP